jgi:hypothetical protein
VPRRDDEQGSLDLWRVVSELKPAHAKVVKHAIDLEMGRIESLATRMLSRVTDHSLNADRQLEELREVAEQLKAIVDRRTGDA